MQDFLTFMNHWGGAVLSLLIGIIFLALSLKDGISQEEKGLGNGSDSYLMRYPSGHTVLALVIILIGAAAGALAGFIPAASDPGMKWIFLAVQVVIGLLFGIIGGLRLRKALVHRIAVKGMQITAQPVWGKKIETSFREIRSVKKDGDSEVTSSSLVLTTNDGEKIEADSKMSNFSQFASQAASNVELPNLAKKRKKSQA